MSHWFCLLNIINDASDEIDIINRFLSSHEIWLKDWKESDINWGINPLFILFNILTLSLHVSISNKDTINDLTINK